ncbi:hypothetical protein M8818_003478 [Zalaria obscura]|uniref:Uncharacterized protein n=1 Tax=Zalaria obscura TaxID=2024903 RepID=A0ACC3SF96_9PEZI
MATPTLMWQRSLSSDVSSVKNTFSGWDSCMSKAYCKWPAIVGIIIGSLILLSLLWCLFRCLCCGAELCACCVSCMTCCGGCCGRHHNRSKGYAQPEAPPAQFQPQPYTQYSSAPPPMYQTPMQPAAPQHAHFEGPSGKKGNVGGYNEDALPAMPSWDNASNRKVEDDVEMQQQPMLPKDHGYGQGGDLGLMNPYEQQQQSPYYSQIQSRGYGRDAGYASPYHSASPTSPSYGQSRGYAHGYGQRSPYEPSIPPSYHTAAPTIAAPNVGRKPVSGSWRDL